MVTATRSAAVEMGMDGLVAARENVEQDRPERALLLRHRNRISVLNRWAERQGHPVLIGVMSELLSDVDAMIAYDVQENRNPLVVVTALEAAIEYAEYGQTNAA